MANKLCKNKTKTIIIVCMYLIIFFNLFSGLNYLHKASKIKKFFNEGSYEYSKEINGEEKQFRHSFGNYYDVSATHENGSFILKINNPCIQLIKAVGLSMKPYHDNESLSIIDMCYSKEDLKIGDVITYRESPELKYIGHRIIDIDYKKKWVRTQGDNPETNPKPDDFIAFDKIIGKEIGVLNTLERKKIIAEEVPKSNMSLTWQELMPADITFRKIYCVCSSNSILKICDVNEKRLLEDSFIIKNEFRKEYCRDYGSE